MSRRRTSRVRLKVAVYGGSRGRILSCSESNLGKLRLVSEGTFDFLDVMSRLCTVRREERMGKARQFDSCILADNGVYFSSHSGQVGVVLGQVA